MKLPTLYKKTSTGALQEWTIEVLPGGLLVTHFGQTGGKIQTSEPTACERKNIGRANETAAQQQAEQEAQSQWEKKQKTNGYVKTKEEAESGGSSELVAGGLLPMLAHKFSEHGDKLKYPCYVQPKLDGHRCIAVVDSAGKCTLWSRTRKPILSAPHVALAVERMGLANATLDGELYIHGMRDNFEELTSLLRKGHPGKGFEAIEYHIYDYADPRMGSFAKRFACLRNDPSLRPPLVLVETREVQNEDELMLAFEDFLAQGYEGAIARNADGLYVNKRSYDLLKIKRFDDGDFWCVAIEEGKGKMEGHAIFVCKNSDGSALFKAKMKGEHAELKQYFEHPELVVNKRVTVKYQGLTNKNNVPRFPVALRIRKDL